MGLGLIDNSLFIFFPFRSHSFHTVHPLPKSLPRDKSDGSRLALFALRVSLLTWFLRNWSSMRSSLLVFSVASHAMDFSGLENAFYDSAHWILDFTAVYDFPPGSSFLRSNLCTTAFCSWTLFGQSRLCCMPPSSWIHHAILH